MKFDNKEFDLGDLGDTKRQRITGAIDMFIEGRPQLKNAQEILTIAKSTPFDYEASVTANFGYKEENSNICS